MPARGSETVTPAWVLEGRVRSFEVRLFHATLIARFAFPVVALLTLLVAQDLDEVRTVTMVVWAVLAVWTGLSMLLSWSHLKWVAARPWIPITEMAVFAVLAFLGLGSQSWHVLHAYVPIAFITYFLGLRSGGIATLGLAMALWGSMLVDRIAPAVIADTPITPLAPSLLAATGFFLVSSVRRVVNDIDGLIAAEKNVRGDLVATRASVARDREVHEINVDVARGLRVHLDGLTVPPVPPGEEPSQRRQALVHTLARIRESLRSLGTVGAAVPERSVDEVITRAADASAALGGDVVVRSQDDAPLSGVDHEALERVLTEALNNARKHGPGTAEVITTTDDEGTVHVEVANPSDAPSSRRWGSLGLSAMEADAKAAGVELDRTHEDGMHRVRVVVPVRDAGDEARRVEGARARFTARFVSYERALLFVRLAFAVLTAVMIPIKAGEHRTILPMLIATSFVLVAINFVGFVWWQRLRPFVYRHPDVAWWDSGLLVVCVAFQGGMSCPWIPVSMGCILTLAHFKGWKAGAALVAMLSGALLFGYWMMTTLPVDDHGTLVQTMPIDWAFNVCAYLVVLAIASGMTWVFARSQDTLDVYEDTVEAEVEALRVHEHLRAAAIAQAQLHHTLRQYVGAALLTSSRVAKDEGHTPDMIALRRQLDRLRTDLNQVLTRLGPPSPSPEG